ncbi:MAG: YwiC-like family protein [Candidatus Marinimicrobia bacterium]|nr:YwiC-like family protein [Candidatus Neomarinimicrobiota bacterium]
MPAQSKWTWLRPVLSAEHGASITLAVCFFLGVWFAGRWNVNTSLALAVAVAGFELQLPLIRLLRRKQLDPRLLIWTALYGIVTVWSAVTLWQRVPALGRIYAVGAAVLVINLYWVYRRDQKSIPNELSIFTGLCLALPFAYTATTGFMAQDLLGLWLLCALVFSSAIFTVRLRLFGDPAVTKATVYHLVALALIFLLVRVNLLLPALAWTFLIPLAKLVVILLWMDRYRTLKLTHIGLIETALAILFALWVGWVLA